MPKALLDKLPDKARDIYEAAWQSAKDDGHDDETAAKIAIAAVKRAGYSKDEETGRWSKMRLIPMHITKATLGNDGVMRWAATTSKFAMDEEHDEITPEFYRYAKAQVAAGKRPDPVLCISHIDKGKPDDSWVAGNVTDLYIDGDLPKAKGIFRDTPLGRAAFEAVRQDYGRPDDEKARISLGFYGEEIVPVAVKSKGTEITGRRFTKGWIKHLALTRVPVVKETEIELMEGKAMAKTKQEDAASIVGAELAAELARKTQEEKAEVDEGLVLKQQPATAEGEPAQEKMSKTIDGEEYGPSAFLVVPDKEKPDTWKLPIEESPGEVTVAQLGRAAAALGPGFRGQKVELEADQRKAAAKRLVGLYHSHDVGDEDVPEYLWELAGMEKPKAEKSLAAKAYDDERANQIKNLLMQLVEVLDVEWTVDIEIANAAATGNKGSNPPRAEPADKAQVTEPPPAAIQAPATPQSVEAAAFVDDFATRVKAVLLSEGDRREKFAALQNHLNTFGEGIATLVKGHTPPSSRDIADVVSEAVQAAVGPVRDQLAGVKAELDELREHAMTLGEGTPPAPRPRSLDTKARVIQNDQPNLLTPPQRRKAWTARELAWASTRQGPGY